MSSQEILNIIEIILSGISAIACLLVIIIFIIAKPLRNDAFKVIFWLNLSNFLKAFSMMFPSSINETSPAICKILGYTTYSSSVAGFLWTALIAIKAYNSIIKDQNDSKRSHKIYAISFFVFSYSFCALPFFFGSYGPNNTNCLLLNNLNGEICRFTLYFFPAIVTILFCSILYAKIIKHLRDNKPNLERDLIRLRYFPLILIFCFTPDIIVRFFQIFGLFSNYVYFIGTFFIRLQGFFDALAYAFTPPVKLYLKLLWEKKLTEKITESDLFKPFV